MTTKAPPYEDPHASRFMRVLLAVILALTLIPTAVLSGTKEAYAVEIPNVGDIYHGSCYIQDTWMTPETSYFNVTNFTGELAGCWSVGQWHCLNPTAAAPSYVGATYTATVSAVSVEQGWVEYDVVIVPPGVTDGVSYDSNGWLMGYQRVGAKARVAKEFGGYIELYKTSANTDITEGNSCYDLQGAVYHVFNKDNKHVATMTTDSTGYAKTSERLPFGWYNVVEVTPPKGYALDESDHWVEITTSNDSTAVVRVSDKPQGDPAMVMVGKIDADTTSDLAQGDTSLAGAEFTVDYYDGYYTTEAEAMKSGTPTRTWVLRTDEDGKARLRETYLVSGSDKLYTNSYGDATIPLGTAVIKETKAPADYVLPTPVPVSVQQITSNNQLENVTTYNWPKIADTVKRGDIAITKAYDDSPEEDTGTMVPEEGITFDFYASHQFEGTTVKEGAAPAFSLTTDENGHADTSKLYIIEQEDGSYSERPRKADDAGALPHDTYLMIQRTSVEDLEKLKPMLIAVAEDGKTYSYLLQNGAVQTPLKVVKVDSETGEVVPYPASWQIIDCSTGEPVSMTTHYPVTETFDVFTSDSQGRLTLPEKLAWGEYELEEVLAPADSGTGYLLNPQNVKFTTADGYDWDSPLEIVFADAPAKGKVEIVKTDEQTGDAVASASYVIQAAEDIYTLDGTLRAAAGEIVDTITTDAQGYAASKELYLGHYEVVEAISPEGFALDTTRHPVALEYADQTVAVVTATLELTDAPTTLSIEKIDSLTGEPMAGVSFTIKADAGDYEQTVTAGEEGTALLGYVPHGSYTVTEVETPFGYVANDETYCFTVDDQGLIEGRSTYSLAIENVPIQVEFSKVDIATSGELPGCGMEIYAADEEGQAVGEALHSWESTGTPYMIVGGLEPGSYILRETYPASGYVTAEEVLFTVEDTGEIQTVTMEDDFTKLDVSKRDITTSDELPGARLAVYGVDEEGNWTEEPLYEWISTGEPYRIEYIEVGDYVLHEDAAPAGYELAQDIAFSITETGEVQSVVMHDELTPDTPDTGKGYDKTGFDMMPLAILAVLLLAGGLLGLGVGIKRYHRNHPKLEDGSEDTVEEDEPEQE